MYGKSQVGIVVLINAGTAAGSNCFSRESVRAIVKYGDD